MVLEGDQNGVINFRASGILFWPIRLLDAVLSGVPRWRPPPRSKELTHRYCSSVSLEPPLTEADDGATHRYIP